MSTNVELTIIHCDLDAFFASVEQRDNPSLQGKPVVVGGEPSSRGVVATCSYEARQYGVRSAMPLAQAFRLCPQAVFLPVDMKRYKMASVDVFKILSSYTPVMETLSLDEAFLDVRGCISIFDSIECMARDIKKNVLSSTGLIISCGISYNKYLAKLGSGLSKPDGLKIICAEEVLDLLTPLPVSYLWGIGQKTSTLLESYKINTIGQLRKSSLNILKKLLGSSTQFYLDLANGLDKRQVESKREAKSMGKEITFTYDINDLEFIDRIVLDFTQILGRRLRKASLKGRTISVKLRYADFTTTTRSKTLGKPCDSDLMIYQTADKLLKEIYRTDEKIRLIGLYIEKLTSNEEFIQGNLFPVKELEENKKLDQVMDNIRERFGEDAITRASLLDHQNKNGNKKFYDN